MRYHFDITNDLDMVVDTVTFITLFGSRKSFSTICNGSDSVYSDGT